MQLRDLLVKIGFDVEKEKLDGVEKQLEGIKSLLEAFAAYEVVKGLVEMTEKFGEMAEKLHLAAVSAGITTEAFQKLAFAAQQNGVSQDELSGAMARITRNLYDARMGSAQAQEAFSRAGLTPGQVQGFKNSSDVLHALADRFKGMKDPIKEMGILLPLAGRGSRDMVAFMEQGAGGMRKLEDQAESLGAVLSDNQVEALVKAQHAMSAFTSVIKTFAATIAAFFAPNLESAIEEILAFYSANKDLLQLEVKKWVDEISFAMGFVWGIIKFVTQAFLDFAKSHEVLVRRIGEFLLLGGAFVSMLFVISKVFGLIKTILGPLNVLLKIFQSEMFIALSPVLSVMASVGLLVVAIHDLWQVAHGRAGWIQHLIDFLGIGEEVQSIFFGIFDAVSSVIQILSDLVHLNFADAFKDFMSMIQPVLNAASFIGEKIGGVLSAIPNFILPGIQTANSAAGTLPGSSNTSILNSQTSGGMNQEINAPVTINVPAGTHPQAVGEKVKEGIKEHLDRVHREAQRSLRPVHSY